MRHCTREAELLKMIRETENFDLSNKTLAEYFHVSEHTIQYTFKNLRDKGLIKQEMVITETGLKRIVRANF